MNLHDCLQWWNVVYLVPFAISLLWILATAMGGLHIGAAHIGGGHGSGHGFGHAHGIGHSHSLGHGHAHSHSDGHNHGTHESGFSQRIMSILGIDQVPIIMLLGVFMFIWGACGMGMNQFFAGIGKYPLVYIWPSMVITFFVSCTITRIMAAVMGRILPSDETFGVTRRELVGLVGKTVFSISAKGGTIDIKDKYGTVHRAQAKIGEEESDIPSGSEVLVLDYDDSDHKFIVKGGGF
jgi:hypothetical protein